jgi:hypothetical protein
MHILQMTSDEKSTKIKVVELQNLWNFVVNNFFHLNSFTGSNSQFILRLF